MPSVAPSHFCIDRSIFPGAGMLDAPRPSIILASPSLWVVLPDTVRTWAGCGARRYGYNALCRHL